MTTGLGAMPNAVDPDLFLAERDTSMRRGGGMEDDRPRIAYTDIEKVLARADGAGQIRKFSVVMHGPVNGVPGADPTPIAMPAEKYQKWWGQGYRPQGYVDLGPPPPPTRWLPSMIEGAIDEGKPIPEEMKPLGYYGPTFKMGVWVDPLTGDKPAGSITPAPTIYYCPSPDCQRFFDSPDGVNGHARSHAVTQASAPND